MERPFSVEQFAIGFVGLSLVYYSVTRMPKFLVKLDEGYRNIVYVTLLVGSILWVLAGTYYLWTNYMELSFYRLTVITDFEKVLALGLVVIIIEATFRTLGRAVGVITLVFIGYYFLGPQVPGLFQHPGGTLDRFLLEMVMNLTGAYGQITRIVGEWVAPFLLFSGLIQVYGGFELIRKFGVWVAGYIRTGVPQMAVIMSGLIASISPGGGANVAITGSITIPAMKDANISATKAGAIESVASTAGQITPPVMGASIFILAGMVGLSFADIVIVAVAPALLYYICTFVAVRETTINDISESASVDQRESAPSSQIDDPFPDIVTGGVVVTAVVILLVLLVIVQYPIGYAAVLAVALMVALGSGYGLLRDMSVNGLKSEATRLVNGAKDGANMIAPLGGGIAAIAMLIQIVGMTGTPAKISFFFLDLTGGSLVLTVILGFFASVLLGLGAPTVAAYLVVAIIIAPLFVNNFAIPEVAAHFFVLYAAVLAALTPPLASTVIIAHQIADSPFIRTAMMSVRIGISLFLLPFTFISYPEIVQPGIFTSNIHIFLLVAVGLMTVTYALNTQHAFTTSRRVNMGIRALILGSGLVILFAPSELLVYGVTASVIVAAVTYAAWFKGLSRSSFQSTAAK